MREDERQAARVGSTLGVMIGVFLLIVAVVGLLLWAL